MTTKKPSKEDSFTFPAEFTDGNHNLIGSTIRIKTRKGDDIEGTLFTIDPVSNFLILEEKDETGMSKCKTHILQVDFLQQIELLKLARNSDSNVLLPHISEEELHRLEQRNKEIAERALASIGKDVSSEAQAIFDALYKTMPCNWDGGNIWVMREVLIKPPYGVENCISKNEAALRRVRKVLEGEKSKLRKLAVK